MSKKGEPAKTSVKGKKPTNGLQKGGQSPADARKAAKKLERSFKIPIPWGKKK